MDKVGMMLIVAAIIGLMGVTGGVEALPPEPTVNAVMNLIGMAVLSLAAGVFGVSLLKEYL